MTNDSQQAVLAYQKEQKVAKKLKKLQAKVSRSSSVSDEDQAALNKLEKKLKKLRQLCKEAKGQAEDTAASTESEDSAVAVPADSSQQPSGKKSKKRDRQAGVYDSALGGRVELQGVCGLMCSSATDMCLCVSAAAVTARMLDCTAAQHWCYGVDLQNSKWRAGGCL